MVNRKNYLLFSLAAIMAVSGIRASLASQTVKWPESAVFLDRRAPDEKLNSVLAVYTNNKLSYPEICHLIADYMGYTGWGSIIIKLSNDKADGYEPCHIYLLNYDRIAIQSFYTKYLSTEVPGIKMDIFNNAHSHVETLYGIDGLNQVCKADINRGSTLVSSYLKKEPRKRIFQLSPIGSVLIQFNGKVLKNDRVRDDISIKNIYVEQIEDKSRMKLVLPSCVQSSHFVHFTPRDNNNFTMLVKDSQNIFHVVIYSKRFGKIDYIDEQNMPPVEVPLIVPTTPTEPLVHNNAPIVTTTIPRGLSVVGNCVARSQSVQPSYLQCLLSKAPYLPHALAATSFGLGCWSVWNAYRNIASPSKLCATAGSAFFVGLAALKLYRNRSLGSS